MSLFRPEALAHRYETGWAQPEPDSNLRSWMVWLVTIVNILVIALLVSLVW